MTDGSGKPLDLNGDGVIDDVEREMYIEFKRKELEDQDAQRDAMRKMTWFALFGMLLYPATIVVTSLLGADKAEQLLVTLHLLTLLLFQLWLLHSLVLMLSKANQLVAIRSKP